MNKAFTCLVGVLALSAPQAFAVTVDLASAMNSSSFISEDAATGSFARIDIGAAEFPGKPEADGLCAVGDIASPTPTCFGSGLDIFPNEESFNVGSLEHAAITGVGVEQVSIDSIDLSGLWTEDSATSDLSDAELDLWFPALNSTFSFGALDPTDTVTYTDGFLTSIDLNLGSIFTIELFGGTMVDFNGEFAISGDAISLLFDDIQQIPSFVGTIDSNFLVNIQGTVGAVEAVNPVPLPAGVWLLGSGLLLGYAGARKRRRA